jgi:hypothetical protein
MRKKYAYYVNNERFSRKDFIEELKECCWKPVAYDEVEIMGRVNICALDEKTFNKKMRQVDNGSIIVDFGENKIFRRKEIK